MFLFGLVALLMLAVGHAQLPGIPGMMALPPGAGAGNEDQMQLWMMLQRMTDGDGKYREKRKDLEAKGGDGGGIGSAFGALSALTGHGDFGGTGGGHRSDSHGEGQGGVYHQSYEQGSMAGQYPERPRNVGGDKDTMGADSLFAQFGFGFGGMGSDRGQRKKRSALGSEEQKVAEEKVMKDPKEEILKNSGKDINYVVKNLKQNGKEVEPNPKGNVQHVLKLEEKPALELEEPTALKVEQNAAGGEKLESNKQVVIKNQEEKLEVDGGGNKMMGKVQEGIKKQLEKAESSEKGQEERSNVDVKIESDLKAQWQEDPAVLKRLEKLMTAKEESWKTKAARKLLAVEAGRNGRNRKGFEKKTKSKWSAKKAKEVEEEALKDQNIEAVPNEEKSDETVPQSGWMSLSDWYSAGRSVQDSEAPESGMEEASGDRKVETGSVEEPQFRLKATKGRITKKDLGQQYEVEGIILVDDNADVVDSQRLKEIIATRGHRRVLNGRGPLFDNESELQDGSLSEGGGGSGPLLQRVPRFVRVMDYANWSSDGGEQLS